MGVLNENTIMGAAGAAGGGFDIPYSLRSADHDSPNLQQSSFQPSTAYTVNFWLKRNTTGEESGNNMYVYRINSADSFYFDTDDRLVVERRSGTITTTREFRDVAQWYNFHVKSSSSAFSIYVNGELVQSLTSGSNPYSAGNFNLLNSGGSNHLDGTIAQFFWIDNQTLNPTEFGETGDYGEWKAKKYEGTFGTDGFHLDFASKTLSKVLSANNNVKHSTTRSLSWSSSSIFFDGSNDSIQTPDSTDWYFGQAWQAGTGNFEIDFWVNFTNARLTGNGHNFFNQWGGGKGWRCFYQGGALKFDAQFNSHGSGTGGTGEIQVINQSWTASTNTWYHLRWNRTNGQFNVFVDGVKQGTGSTNTNQMNNLAQVLRFGSDGGSATNEHMEGYVDDIHIKKNYTSGTSNFSVPTAYSPAVNSTVLLIQSKSQSNNSTTFTDYSGTANSYGTDVSGQNNHFTTVSGMDHRDQLTDSPTNNFPTLNSLIYYPFTGNSYTTTFRNGSLGLYTGGSQHEPSIHATMAIPTSGKWYCEILQQTGGSSGLIGIRGTQPGTISPEAKDNPGKSVDGYAWYGAAYVANLVNNDGYVTYGSTLVGYGNSDVMSIAVDMDNNKLYFAKNGTWIASGNPSNGTNGHSIIAPENTRMGHYFFAVGEYDSNNYAFDCNFGQDPTMHGEKSAGTYSDSEGLGAFQYAVPTGFKTLCAKNLPEPGCTPSENFNTIAYSGNSTSGRVITGVGFQPDMVWIKGRNIASSWTQHDAVRGATKRLASDMSNAETTQTEMCKAFNSDGFTVGNNNHVNDSSYTYVSYNWKLNGTGSSNSNGSITATVSANTAAGQSIMIYNGASGNGTVGHGLSKKPELIIVKARSNADQWRVGTAGPKYGATGNPDFTDYFKLNASDGYTDESSTWNDTAPTSTVITVGTDSATNHPGYTHIAYCFHDVEGYSKIGQYKGTFTTDGGFVYLGFRPAWVLIKAIGSSQNWVVFDNKRNPYNPMAIFSHTDDHASEKNQSNMIDFLSNGMKMRRQDSWHNNTYSDGYFYYAVAEQPFKYSNAK